MISRNFCKLFFLSLSLMIGSVLVHAQDRAMIPTHPRDLKYKPVTFSPPKRSEYRHVLSNGVVVYIAEDHQLPMIKLGLKVRGGGYLNPAGKEGLASMTAHQMRVGGTVSKTPQEFEEDIAFLAADLNVYMGETQGGALLQVLSKDTDRGLSLLFDMLKNPRFDDEMLKLAKSGMVQNMARRNDSTSSIEGREWSRLMYGSDFFLTKNTTKASIESITREDMLAYHKKFFQPGGFIISVSGDFNAKEMIARLESALKGWVIDKTPLPPIPNRTFKPAPGIYAVDKPDVNQTRISLGHIGITRDNPDRDAIQIMNGILGSSGFASRIMNRVRSDEGLAYSAGSSFGIGTYYPGNFQAFCQSKNISSAQAIALIMEEIERIRTSKVTPEELDVAKNSSIDSFPVLLSSADQIVGIFSGDEFTGLPADYWDHYIDRVKAVTADDVLRVAQKYLKPQDMVILVVGKIDEVLKGNPDKPQFSLTKFAKDGQIKRIPLPDPMTMTYPQ